MTTAEIPSVAPGQYDDTGFRAYCDTLTKRYPQNKKILFVQIPQVILDAFNKGIALNRGYYIFPPTGLQYIYEATKHRDIEVEILDLNYEILHRVHEDENFDPLSWPDILQERLRAFQPTIVGVSCLFDVGIKPMLQTLRAIRAEGKAITVGGGVIATYEWKTLLGKDLCHFVVRGEGENKFNFLLDHLLEEKCDTAPVTGIYYNDGEFRESAGAPDNVEIRSNLIDSYNLVPIENYYKYGSLNPFSRMDHVDKAPFAAIQLCRGCRAQCTFCAVRDFMGKGVRFRDVKNTIEEMEFLVEKKGVRHFELLDDDPTFYRHEFKAILRTIIERKWDIRWSANNGVIAATVDEETLALMRDSGCIGFKVGIETGNPDMLKKVKKPATHQKFLKLSKMLEGYPEIFVGGNFIVGLPEESFYMMMDSFKFILDVNLDWAAITVCQVIRGASAFSDSGEYFETQMKEDGANVSNFIPSRNSSIGQIAAHDGVLTGVDIFAHAPEAIPSANQVKEIWFTFNMVGNYIFNKNLMPGGRPDKFISWVKNAQKAYPTNPNMHLFMGLAYVLKGDLATAIEMRDKAREFGSNAYWSGRFNQFGLQALLDNYPETPQEVFDTLTQLQNDMRVHFQDWLDVDYGGMPTLAQA